MKQIRILLRHAETEPVQNIPVQRWKLTQKGTEQARRLPELEDFKEVDAIITSTEEKAIQTATPLAEKLDLDMIHLAGLCELHRGDIFLTNEDYHEGVKHTLSTPETEWRDWEQGYEALTRFQDTMNQIGTKSSKVLVVSHGLVLSLFFAKLLGIQDQTFLRWKQLRFCEWGVVSNGIVIKDIV